MSIGFPEIKKVFIFPVSGKYRPDHASSSANPTITGMVTAEIAVCTDTTDEASSVSLPNRAANMLSSAAGGALAAMSSTSVRSWGTRSARHIPSDTSGSTTRRSTAAPGESPRG